MKKILVFGMTENPGGIESFLVNYYRNINKELFQFDFLCNSHNPVAYEDELKSLGANVYHITARSMNRFLYWKELNEVFKEHCGEWDAIWVNVCSLANIDYLIVAKKYGILKRIIHSHNSQNMDSRLRGLLHLWNKRHISKYATDYWACSEEAANWFYDSSVIKEVVIIHNAIDVERMKFDIDKRNDLRKKLSIDDKYVIGNIGRLHFQKNQEFAIEVFERYHTKHPDSVLIFVGQGENEEVLKEKVEEYKMCDDVRFVGIQKDIQAWLSCFDLFLFPSRFEGLSVAAMEAQSNSLPVLASKNVIPEEVKMNDNFIFLDLDAGAETWCECIEKMRNMKRLDYQTVKTNFVENGYDINTEVSKLERLLVD